MAALLQCYNFQVQLSHVVLEHCPRKCRKQISIGNEKLPLNTSTCIPPFH